ncbi:ferritin-like domain-containing protein [Arenibaculum sp.]|uniref:ferritin-like domain-containing protein n=1 Tax=Arenibaculum sp. TaxID=2865862 RepID=UPI002E134842|nr:ferritin-like domain-containing protein [Arenibaculum sp.]
MAQADKEILVEWLRDAYALEMQAIDLLTAQVGRLQHYPEVQARLRRHADESRQQANLVRSCLVRHGSDVSVVKTGLAHFMAGAQAVMTSMTADEVVRDVVATFAFENLEIGTYRALLAAAQACGDDETRRVCEEILRQEEEMASWIGARITEVAGTYISRRDDFDFGAAKR